MSSMHTRPVRVLVVPGATEIAMEVRAALGHRPDIELYSAGIADGTHDFPTHVLLAAHKVVHDFRERIVKHAVDGEVPSLGIFLGRAVGYRFGTAAVFVFSFRSERRHFDLDAGAFGAEDDDDPKALPDRQRSPSPEQVPDLIRRGVCRDIIISGILSPQKVAHAPPGPVSNMPRVDELANNFDGELP